jgi:hypothetical protein
MTGLRLLSIELMTHLPSTLTAEVFYRGLLAEIRQNFQACFQSRLASLDTMLENHLQNFWANLPQSWRATPIEGLRNRWSDRPLIITAAGPSLTEALPILSASKGNALLLATGATARLLLEHEIPPDLVISFDPYRANLAHFQGWDTSTVPLVYYHQTYREVVDSYSGPRFYFLMQEDPPLPLMNAGEKSLFRQGGSVSFSALQLAHYLNANPIIFVGQDFAFPGNHTHAPGAGANIQIDPEALPGDYFRVPGVDGKPVITNRMYYSYLLYMQDYLLDYVKRNPGAKHINTSQAGAIIQGMESMPIEQALAMHREASHGSPRETIDSALRPSPAAPHKARKTTLKKWVAEIDRLVDPDAPLQTPDRLFARFKATSLCAQAARKYDDIFYLYEARFRDRPEEERAEFLTRFMRHLQFLAEELRRIEASE